MSSKAEALDPVLLRRAFGAFATGVAVIGTHAADGTPVGMTVNSFASVSLSPPLVSFCPARTSLAFPVYSAMTHFSVNVLAEEQRAVSDRFAQSVQENKWAGVPYHLGEHAVPVIEDALASFECAVEHRVEAGDHVIVIGRVLRIHGPRDKKPLIFHASRYGSLSAEEVPGPEEILGWDS